MTVCTSVCLFFVRSCVSESMTMPCKGRGESEKTSAQHACSGAGDLYRTFVKISLVCFSVSERKYNKGT